MNQNALSQGKFVTPEPEARINEAIDADTSGHLATGLFVGAILVLLVVIYAFAMAA